ncbi:MAG: FAD-binding oxidoreductase [Candidatus Dependentiae bacterium]|nr:FAD-binding oxidoreductase [Candidatus Dependentiae bacterium]
MTELRKISLTAPQFSERHIKEKIICVRAHRERAFCIEHQHYADKQIFHNYGQGGAGLTFLFGSVNQSLQQFTEFIEKNQHLKNEQITIVGAGAYGLLTALCLARAGYSVQILAQELEKTSSYNAAGFFFPRSRKTSTEQERAVFHTLGMESYKIYLQIINGRHPFINNKAASLMPVYFGLDIDPGYDLYVANGLVEQPEKVLIDFGSEKKYQALEYKTVFINAHELITQLHKNIQELGVTTKQQTIDSFSNIPSSIIFNCTGIGAKQLTGDKKLLPVQGHLVALKNQDDMNQLQYMLNMKVVMRDEHGNERDELIYYAPKEGGVLGITFIRGRRSLEKNEHEFDRILKRCHDFFG